MTDAPRRELGTWQRGRLAVALVVLTAFAVVFAAGLGVAIHDHAEARDSLAHWQARLEEEAASTQPPVHAIASDAPAVRIRRLEEELERLRDRMLLLAVAVVVTAVLVLLGVRAFRKGVPAR